MYLIILLSITISSFILYSVTVFYLIYSRYSFKARHFSSCKSELLICSFFHPNCHSGGGGERVLWEAIKSFQAKYKNVLCVIYCDNTSLSDKEILDKVKSSFDIEIDKDLKFVRLNLCRFIYPEKYKRFTLVGQAIGSIIVAFEAIIKCVPNIYIDTVGYAFTFPIFKYFALCKTIAYVHYPTISLNMINKVIQRQSHFNNNNYIANNMALSKLKSYYYKGFAFLYYLVGNSVDLALVNSNWTKNHMDYLWKKNCKLVYPPCELNFGNTKNIKRKPWIISLAQFRAEKDHVLQIKAFHNFIKNFKEVIDASYNVEDLRLILIGGCRDVEDTIRVEKLQTLCKELKIDNIVSFKCNIPFWQVSELLNEGLIGLHTMNEEHFGIAIVESMASGLIMVAHNSGGPKLDIINNEVNGFLCSTLDEYSKTFKLILEESSEHWISLRKEAEVNIKKFCKSQFEFNIIKETEHIFI